jgi:hypothetical protein
MLFLKPFGCHKTIFFWGKKSPNGEICFFLRMARFVYLLGVLVAKFPKKQINSKIIKCSHPLDPKCHDYNPLFK